MARGNLAYHEIINGNQAQIVHNLADKLGQTVRALASSPDLRSHLIAGGLQTARSLTSDGQAQRIEERLLRASRQRKV